MKKEFDAKRVELGTRIRRLRKSRDLSQDNFAEELDISAVTVSRIENGSAAPDVWLLLKMTKVLDVSVEALVGTRGGGDRERENLQI